MCSYPFGYGNGGFGFGSPLPTCPHRCCFIDLDAFRSLFGNLNPTPKPTLFLTNKSTFHGIVRNPFPPEDDITDERYTPDWILDVATSAMGGIDLDPCADPRRRVPASHHFTKKEDGLEQGWSGRVFLNPPFSKVPLWLRTLSLFIASGAVSEAVVLLPITSLANKSARLLLRQQASGFVLLERTLCFLDENYLIMPPNAFIPSVLLYVGTRYLHFTNSVGNKGVVCTINQQHTRTTVISCKYCGKSFGALRSTAKYCGVTCRVEAHKKKARLSSVI